MNFKSYIIIYHLKSEHRLLENDLCNNSLLPVQELPMFQLEILCGLKWSGVHRTVCTMHGALCTVHCEPCIVHRAVCIVHCALFIVHCASCIVNCAVCIMHCASCTVHCAVQQNLKRSGVHCSRRNNLARVRGNF